METIRQCMALFSNEHEASPQISSSSNEDPQSEPFEPADWKDKGKGVLEYSTSLSLGVLPLFLLVSHSPSKFSILNLSGKITYNCI